MYYHPYMFHWANGERALATCQACVGLWLDDALVFLGCGEVRVGLHQNQAEQRAQQRSN